MSKTMQNAGCAAWRLWSGFALLALILFGLLAYAAALVFTWHPRGALAVIALIVVLSKVLPGPIAWLTMLGASPESPTPDAAA